MPKLPEGKREELVKYLVAQGDVKMVANIHDWFVDNDYIKEDVADVVKDNDETETQYYKFLNPEPGSKYFEEKWPKGNFIFVRISVTTIVLHA